MVVDDGDDLDEEDEYGSGEVGASTYLAASKTEKCGGGTAGRSGHFSFVLYVETPFVYHTGIQRE